MSKEPNRNVYVGHRYVPKIMGEWDQSIDYEGLSIVTHNGTSYTSKKRVPVGIDILNNEFWVVTGNYNAQVENYREETERVSNELINKTDKTYVDTELGKLDTEIGKKSDKEEVIKIEENINSRMINVKYPDNITGALGDGTDETLKVQEVLDTIPTGHDLYIPNDVYFKPNELFLKDNVDVIYSRSENAGEDIILMNKYHANGVPINEFELSSPYHTGLILNSNSEINSNVPATDTTLARSIVFRLDNKSQVILTTSENGRFLFRHVNDPDNRPHGDSVFSVDAERSEFILGQAMRMSTRKGSVSTIDINSRPLFSYSNYIGTNIFIDNVSGNDDTGDGTIDKPFKTFEKANYELIPHIIVGDVNIYLLSDYNSDFTLSGIINTGFRANIRSYGPSNKYEINGIGNLDHLYGKINFANMTLKKHLTIKHCFNTIFSGHEVSGSDYGFLVEDSNIKIEQNNFNGVNYGVRADDSKVLFDNNTGNCSTNTVFSRDGAVVNISGTKPEGTQRTVLSGIITPGASGYLTDVNGKSIIVSNGIITEIRESQV